MPDSENKWPGHLAPDLVADPTDSMVVCDSGPIIRVARVHDKYPKMLFAAIPVKVAATPEVPVEISIEIRGFACLDFLPEELRQQVKTALA